jgi:hypothetical protein
MDDETFMPKVGNKSFPYTPAGMRAAKAASKKMPKKRKKMAPVSTDMGTVDPAMMQMNEMRRRGFGM